MKITNEIEIEVERFGTYGIYRRGLELFRNVVAYKYVNNFIFLTLMGENVVLNYLGDVIFRGTSIDIYDIYDIGNRDVRNGFPVTAVEVTNDSEVVTYLLDKSGTTIRTLHEFEIHAGSNYVSVYNMRSGDMEVFTLGDDSGAVSDNSIRIYSSKFTPNSEIIANIRGSK